MTAPVLAAAAFGAGPGRHPLPPAADDHGRWLRAVALGGQGRYARAAAELAVLDAAAPGPGLRSLAASTRASHLRQLGGHALAARWDARALGLAGGAGAAPAATARCDALVGLAADALGPGRVALARRLLERARPELAAAEDRCTVRWHWVVAETALCGDDPALAREHAALAVRRAEELPSVRHRVKSLLVEAAATGSAELAERARAASAEHGLLPLRWAATMLLLAVDVPRSGVPGGGQVQAENTRSHDMLTRRGGVLPGTPVPLQGSRPWSAPSPTTAGVAGPDGGTGSPGRGQDPVRGLR